MDRLMAVRGGAGDILTPNPDVRLQDNLYLAVNSKWLKEAKIPADRSRITSFDGIDLGIEKHLMADFADFAAGKKPLAKVANLDKAVKLYHLASDFDQRNRQKAEPIKEDLAFLVNLRDFDDLVLKSADLDKFASLPLAFYVDADMKNTKVNVLHFGGPSTFLPDTTTYQTEACEQLLAVLKKQSINLLKMAGISEEDAQNYATLALKFDQRLSKIVKSSEEWADYPAIYNPMKLADFEAKFKDFKIDYFLNETLPQVPDRLIVTEPRYLDHINELLSPATFKEVRAWMIVNFINDNAAYLSQDFREAAFPFSQALSGQPELASGLKQAYRIANSAFSEVVGVYYGQKYFGQDAKKDVLDMIHQMIEVYQKRLKQNTWLSEATKEKAIVKLNAMILKVGYPDKIEAIYDRLPIIPADEGGSLYSNIRAQRIERAKYMVEKLQKPVDRSVWLMPGNLVNACYDPQRNDLTFPAAILQAPFYSLKQSRAANYGGIGTVIAHEISHAFDNNGAKFDEFGNMVNWWSEADFAEFKKRTQKEIDLFDKLTYGPVKLNGKQIVSENIADQGGLTAATQAAKAEGDDLAELFINFAKIWANKQHEASIKTQCAIDVHAPGPMRANVQTQCQDDFYRVFDVKPGDGMWLDPEDRVHIW